MSKIVGGEVTGNPYKDLEDLRARQSEDDLYAKWLVQFHGMPIDDKFELLSRTFFDTQLAVLRGFGGRIIVSEESIQ